MKLEPAQKTWLTKLDGKVKLQAKLQAQEDLKRAMLSKLLGDRQDGEDELREGTQHTVIKEGTRQKQQTQDYLKRKQDKLFDLDEQKQGFVLATAVKGKMQAEDWNKETGQQKEFQKLQAAGRIVDSLALQMQMQVDELDENGDTVMEEVTDDKGVKVKQPKKVPLFKDAEIKDELYTPLVRSGLIPETNVPDDFSETKEMLDGSMGAYANRLSKEQKKSKFDENKALGIAVFRGMVSFTGTGLTLASDSTSTPSELTWTPSTSEGLKGIHQDFGLTPYADGTYAGTVSGVAEGGSFVQNLSDMAFDIGREGYLDIQDKVQSGTPPPDDKDPIQKNAGKVGGLAVAEIATALGGALNGFGLGTSASSAFGALVRGPDVAKKLGKLDIAGAAAPLWTAFAATLTKLGPQAVGQDKDKISQAVARAKTAFDGALKSDAIVKDLKAQAFDKAASGLAAAGVAAAKVIENDVGVNLVFSDQNHNAAAETSAGQVVAEEFERDDSPKPTQKQIDKHPKEHAAQWVWIQEEKEFICLKCPGKGEDPELFAGILERKIAELESDAAIWKWITTIGGMAFDVASDFVAPLAMGGALLRMVKNAREAYKRWADFTAFLEDRAAMVNAASAFSAPLAQFVHNSSQQHLHYTLNAAMEGMKIVAAALQLGAITAPAGVGMSAGIAASQTIEGIVYEAKKRWDLSTAWDTYKQALENPENRKFGLIALKKNPTLAKYAVAWGALIKKDPLVSDFMGDCGLNKDTLKDPEANVDLVVKYLEKRMPDDNVVVGRDYSAVGKVELTMKFWIKERTKGETKLGVKPQETKRLEFLLSQWETEYPLQKAANPKDPEAVKKCKSILDEIDIQLTNYKVHDKDGKPAQEMITLKQRYFKRTDAFKAEIKSW